MTVERAVGSTDAPERHVVLVHPEVHWNTGNAGRTCLGAGAKLHLIRPLGFSLSSRQVRRAGLDYWRNVDVSVWDDFRHFRSALHPEAGEVALFAKRGSRSFRTAQWPRRSFLIFGSESGGMPEALLSQYADAVYHIPVNREIRSLNLSTAVGIALYESLKGCPMHHGWAG